MSPPTGGSTVPITEVSAEATTDPPLVAETGVPGLDSDDAFCRSWSEFSGTFQALALTASLAADPSDAARAEVAAASTIVAAWRASTSTCRTSSRPSGRR